MFADSEDEAVGGGEDRLKTLGMQRMGSYCSRLARGANDVIAAAGGPSARAGVALACVFGCLGAENMPSGGLAAMGGGPAGRGEI